MAAKPIRQARRYLPLIYLCFAVACWAATVLLAQAPYPTPKAAAVAPDSGVLAHSWAFIVAVTGNLLLFAACGEAVSRSPLAILRTGRNTLSLSRLQMVAWSALVIAAITAAAACRGVALGANEALALRIPPELLQVMGISFVSAAAAPAILSLKSQPADVDQVQAAAHRMGEALVRSDQLVRRPMGSRVRLADLVRGDDLNSAGSVDLGKVQQLAISALVIAVYATVVATFFRWERFGGLATGLPRFSSDFVTLLLVSHGGYLALKAASKPESSPASRPPPPGDRNAP